MNIYVITSADILELSPEKVLADSVVARHTPAWKPESLIAFGISRSYSRTTVPISKVIEKCIPRYID